MEELRSQKVLRDCNESIHEQTDEGDDIDRFADEYGIPIVTFNTDLEDCSRLSVILVRIRYECGRAAAGLRWSEIIGGRGEVGVITGYRANPV